MSAGSMSGVNWMRWKEVPEMRLRQRLEGQVLASPGTPSSRRWPFVEQSDDEAVDQVALADDDFGPSPSEASRPRALPDDFVLQLGRGGANGWKGDCFRGRGFDGRRRLRAIHCLFSLG